MREKAVERRNVNKEHNSNFKAGYIPIDEERLHKTGLRGRKGNLAICVIILLFILAVINLIVSIQYRIFVFYLPWGIFRLFFSEIMDFVSIISFGTLFLFFYSCFISLLRFNILYVKKPSMPILPCINFI